MKARVLPTNIIVEVYFHHISATGEKIYADKYGEYLESELIFIENESNL